MSEKIAAAVRNFTEAVDAGRSGDVVTSVDYLGKQWGKVGEAVWNSSPADVASAQQQLQQAQAVAQDLGLGKPRFAPGQGQMG